MNYWLRNLRPGLLWCGVGVALIIALSLYH
jgi:hypothetical protein